MEATIRVKDNNYIAADILDDLASRFIINVPDDERSNFVRICFQIELAHWFYLDFYCTGEDNKSLTPCGIKQFANHIFNVRFEVFSHSVCFPLFSIILYKNEIFSF